MNKRAAAALCLIMMLTAVSCGNGSADTGECSAFDVEASVDMEKLKDEYPEFFEHEGETCKDVEVYVWQMSENSYSCGLVSGANRDKTDGEIMFLQEKPLTVDEAKALLNEMGVTKESVFICPVVQPYSSYYYEISDEYVCKVWELFGIDEIPV